MKIRCKNCYRVLNPNEEYCTACGEHSVAMQKAMITGDYGPDNAGKLKISLTIYAIAGFLVCGILQVIFALLQNKEISTYTDAFCEANSIFFSGLLTFILTLVFSMKDMKKTPLDRPLSTYIIALFIGIITIAIIILLSKILTFTQVFPSYIVKYLSSGSAKFFDVKNECIFKIVTGFIFVAISIEVLCRKRLVDALDETLLGEKTIFIITILVTTALETLWIMSLDVVIPLLSLNIVLTGIYMYTNRNIFINIVLRVLLIIIAIIITL